MNTANKGLLSFLEDLHLAAVIADTTTGEILWVNGPHTALSGADSPDRIVGRNIFEFLGPDQMAQAMHDMEAVAAGAIPPPVVYHVRRLDGGTADVHIASVPVWYGKRAAMVSILTDVTESERMKRDLARTEARFRDMVDTAPLGILVIHGETLMYANRTASRVLGRSQAELAGSLATSHVAAGSRAALRRVRDVILSGAESSAEVELTFVPAEGEPLHVTCTLSPADWDGEPGYRISMRSRSTVE